MPLYEYECAACHRRTEKIQKFSDPELTVCPFCSGALARTITAPAVQFKGAGWYKDLYSSAKPPAATGDTTPAAKEGSSETPATAAATKSETAPAANTAAPAPATSSSSTATT